MLWRQDSYLERISDRLDGFAKNGTIFNFRCPVCGDSKRDKTKKRGYLFAGENGYRFFCHNCQASMSFYDFLRFLDTDIAKEFIVDKLRSDRAERNESRDLKVNSPEKPIREVSDLPDDIFVPVTRLPSIDPVKRYIASRSIPRQQWGRLYAAPHFLRVGEFVPDYAERIPNDSPRLVLPVRNVLNRLVALVCRAVGNDEPRYMNISINEEPAIFGIETVRFDQPVIVVEGPIDSLFLPNCVAVGGSDLQRIGKVLVPEGCVLVYDNQPRNKEVVKTMLRAANQGFRVMVWPEDTPGKDINEMIDGGWSIDKITSLIEERTFTGLRLQTEIAQWKKVELIEPKKKMQSRPQS